MNIVSKAALAAALVIGSGGVMAVPALAKDKQPAADAGPTLKLSDSVRKAAVEAQTALKANDAAASETAIAATEAAAKTDDEKYIATGLRLQFEASKLAALQNDPKAYAQAETRLAPSLDALIANPKTPPADVARYTYLRGKVAFDNRDYGRAIPLLTKAQQLGYQSPDLGMELTQAKLQGGDVAGGSADLVKQIDAKTAAGQKAPEDWYRYLISQNMKAKDRAGTVSAFQKYVSAYPTSKNWRDAVITYGFSGQGSPQLTKVQQVDLFRLLRANRALADQNDYNEYAQDAIDLGLPNEAKAVIEEGRAAGKIPAANTSSNALYADAKKGTESDASLAPLAAKAASSANGKLAQQTADAYLGSGNYTKAAELYRVALQKGGVDNDAVNTHLGIALARSGDKAGAQAAFGQVAAMPGKDIASFWTTYLTSPAAG